MIHSNLNVTASTDRIIPIGERAIDALWEYDKAYRSRFEMEPRGANPIFPSRQKMRITTRQLQRALYLRMKLAGIGASCRMD
jgi:site-specific recombinase XerD